MKYFDSIAALNNFGAVAMPMAATERVIKFGGKETVRNPESGGHGTANRNLSDFGETVAGIADRAGREALPVYRMQCPDGHKLRYHKMYSECFCRATTVPNDNSTLCNRAISSGYLRAYCSQCKWWSCMSCARSETIAHRRELLGGRTAPSSGTPKCFSGHVLRFGDAPEGGWCESPLGCNRWIYPGHRCSFCSQCSQWYCSICSREMQLLQ